MRMYDLAEEYRRALDVLEEADGELDDEALALFDGLAGSIADKIDALVKAEAELLAEAEAVGKEAIRLQARSKAIRNRAARCREWVGNGLRAMSLRKLTTTTHTVSIVQGPPRVVLDVEPDAVPATYLLEQPPRVDRKAILADLKASGDRCSWAHLERGESVRVR